ncbi:phosphopyruvate hydratase [Candidatus Saccharibacteria bacterium]|nr:phosphopyruvate hydratase [Candidatus Saccharibacteria bacterium]
MKISSIEGRQILDSRGNPTVEVDVWLDGGHFGRAAVPSGASTGAHEAVELRDGGSEYGGLGVQKAVDNIASKIYPELKGIFADDQYLIDKKLIDLDGTDDKSNLGANATLAVSLAVAHAAAKARGVLLYKHINDIAHNPAMSLPLPMMNVLNGGKHATQSADFQEYMIIPRCGINFADTLRIGTEIFHALKQELSLLGFPTSVGDEGGFTFPVRNANTEPLDMLFKACRSAGYEPGEDISFALDVASTELFKHGEYSLGAENRKLSSRVMVAYLEEIAHRYPVISIEDGLAEDDWEGWSMLTNALGRIQLVGDDLTVTNLRRLKRAVEEKAGNAILIKPNQIGTLTETIKTIEYAKKQGWRTIVSHRSGETEDVSIVHLAVGTGADQIKTGSLSRGERTAKYNELLRLEQIDPMLQLAQPFVII